MRGEGAAERAMWAAVVPRQQRRWDPCSQRQSGRSAKPWLPTPACCTCTRVIPLQAENGDLLQTNLAGFGPAVTGASGGAAAAGGTAATAGSGGAPAPTKIKLKVVGGKKDKKVRCKAACLPIAAA